MFDHSPTTIPAAGTQWLQTIQEPCTADTYRCAMHALTRFLAGEDGQSDHQALPQAPYPIHRLEIGFLEDFYLWLSENYARPSVHTYLAAVRRFLAWLDAHDLLSMDFQLSKALNRLDTARGEHGRASYKHRRVDPDLAKVVLYYDELELPEPDNGWKARQERLRLLRNRALVHTLYASAGRVSEVVNLTREMVLEGRAVEVHLVGKGSQARVILLANEARSAIRAYLNERKDGSPWLFYGRNVDKPLSRKTAWRLVKEAAQALDLHESTSPHSFRHYRATQLLNEGMPLESVQAYLGHRDISTTRKVYAHTKTAVLREQLDTFGLSPADALKNGAISHGASAP